MQVVLSSFRVASASNVVDGVNDVGGRSRRFDDCTVLPGWSCERGLFEFVLCFKGNVGGFARRCDGIDGACCAEVGGGATSETGRGGGHCKVVVVVQRGAWAILAKCFGVGCRLTGQQPGSLIGVKDSDFVGRPETETP